MTPSLYYLDQDENYMLMEYLVDYEELRHVLIRGNVDTRIRKLNEGIYDAIILSFAGIKFMFINLQSSLAIFRQVNLIFQDETACQKSYLFQSQQKNHLDILRPRSFHCRLEHNRSEQNNNILHR